LKKEVTKDAKAITKKKDSYYKSYGSRRE